MARTTIINGQLQIDHDRGVVYFHADEEETKKLNSVTVLRICRLPVPIPCVRDRQLDIVHMTGCDWRSGGRDVEDFRR